tara:strand:+ start:899 stop:1399 length:501 start_codon:yes stop_codon:yes gene_type:complete
MNEQRFVVSDILLQRLEPHLPGKVSDAGVTAKDNRMFLEAVFWRVRTGRRGATYRLPLATGTASSGGLPRFAGDAKASIQKYSTIFQLHIHLRFSMWATRLVLTTRSVDMTKARKASNSKSVVAPRNSGDRRADTLNANKGTTGQNKSRAKNQGNRGNQLNPNRKT